MAAALRAGRVDVALIPVVEAFRDPRLQILQAPAIGCRRAVKSVRLLSRAPLKEVRVLLADSNSATSVLLSRLLIKRVFGVKNLQVKKTDTSRFKPTRLKAGEALLQIGDIALEPAPRGLKVRDLGLLWHRMTGLPFVFSPWMVLRGKVSRGATALLNKTVKEGMKRPSQVVRAYAPLRGRSPRPYVRYLKENLSFRLGPSEWKAIRLFKRLLHEEGLL